MVSIELRDFEIVQRDVCLRWYPLDLARMLACFLVGLHACLLEAENRLPSVAYFFF